MVRSERHWNGKALPMGETVSGSNPGLVGPCLKRDAALPLEALLGYSVNVKQLD